MQLSIIEILMVICETERNETNLTKQKQTKGDNFRIGAYLFMHAVSYRS